MYLKSLTLKGFKSFADPTTIELWPGVTVVVGPNGSGKSNVVDAVAWVLGAQGPRVVRSARMDDVIFAGTDKRPALGRAEVSLTIDNTSRRLPVDLSEITVTRTLFRTGESEYALNGAPCRLLDVQELLSDTGVGRQQHVIIGQGQLDTILGARPEERRAVVEEAAGILKYRRRRERAERRLEASESSLARLQDLLREVRRQVRPLERQAAAALRHGQLADDLAAARLHLAGQELVALDERLTRVAGEAARTAEEVRVLAGTLEGLDEALNEAEGGLGKERADELTPVVSRLERSAERALGVLALARDRRASRAALFAAALDASDVAGLEEELAGVDEELRRCEEAAGALAPDWEALVAAEAELVEVEATDDGRFGGLDAGGERPLMAVLRADHARALDALARAREREIRAGERRAALAERRKEILARLGAAEVQSESLRLADERAAKEATHANEALAVAEDVAGRAAEARRAAEAAHGGARARVEALGLALEEARARAGLERLAGLPGVVGTLLDVADVDDDLVHAFEAAVEGALGAVLMTGVSDARRALEHLRGAGQGGAVLPLRGLPGSSRRSADGRGHAFAGTQRLRARVRARDGDEAVEALLDRLLDGVLVSFDDLPGALAQALAEPEATIVTLTGDRLSPTGWRLAAGAAGATRSALEAAEADVAAAAAAASAAAIADQRARAELEAVRQASATALRDADRLSAERSRNASAVVAWHAELDALDPDERAAAGALVDAQAAVTVAASDAAELAEAVAAAQADEDALLARRAEAAAARGAREARARAVASLRRDLEVRVAALEERRGLLDERHRELAGRLDARRAARQEAQARRVARDREDVALGRLAEQLAEVEGRARAAAGRLAAERDRRVTLARERLGRVSVLRQERDDAERALLAARDRAQGLRVDETEARVRREAVAEALWRDLGAGVEEALAAPAPDLPEGVDTRRRIDDIEAELRQLGPVNPLAAEELAELETRSAFLQSQLDDVQRARRELGQVIRAVDAEIADVFAAAYADVERHFSSLFATLFPGGAGRLGLTAPDDLLATGIDIDARPAGRNVRRLSLLSGGERSLVALAFLFAVFRSRPSPFYVLDEVEAALDEVNLRRFLELLEEFRSEAQLVVVSHQKRTMEVADALYGVSMQPGGASKVVSERLRAGAEVS